MTIYIFLSHDVDWGKSGAPISHIMARKDRFDENTIKNMEIKNPYYNIPDLVELENNYNVRSTFFFRTNVANSKHPPPTYDLADYKPDIRSMCSGGWEIALHSDFVSFNDLKHLEKEKTELENIAGTKIYGNRVHYTLTDTRLFSNLKKLNFKYDSSVKNNREQIVKEDFGYFRDSGLIIFPITFMDALVFSYLTKNEVDILKVLKNTLKICEKFESEKKILTLIWHNCVLKMKFGRMYSKILDYLNSLKDVDVKRGIDLVNLIEKGDL